jgi:hypothetical protein
MTDHEGWALVGPDGKVYDETYVSVESHAWRCAYVHDVGCMAGDGKGGDITERTHKSRLKRLGYRVAKVKLVEVAE